ncbi:hypothetical protein GN244_ATG00658 [Phytophthora infestans]|uniref:Uncharacterized protein n=1 Tax=Phytophthora infestans TaxID=4787 RepID=A0A833TUD7_PHYIN|nr:hypothetical protein GN244_ATG00658 [Phytophthora infestans]KAF4127545.1 hypothetical protein GN958_ATG23274 [Phytophthora infestans]
MGKPKDSTHLDANNNVKHDHPRALGQVPVATPASTTTGNTLVTQAPIKLEPTPMKATTALNKPKTKEPSPKRAPPLATKPTPKQQSKATPAATQHRPNLIRR